MSEHMTQLIERHGEAQALHILREAALRLYADAKEFLAAWRSGNPFWLEGARKQLECTLVEIDAGAP